MILVHSGQKDFQILARKTSQILILKMKFFRILTVYWKRNVNTSIFQ
jgi:hypothetical protein